MGLIKAVSSAIGGTMDDIWKELFVCDALPMEILMVRGSKRISNRSANTAGNPNIITHGSVIVVSEGQCALVGSGGRVIDCCSEPGEYIFHDPDRGSFAGSLLREVGQRISFGGDAPPKTQRVYYVNMKESMNNPFRTERPIDLRAAGAEPLFGTVICSGVFSYRIQDPIRFYKLLAGNVTRSYRRKELDGQITAELMKALGPVLNSLCVSGVRPSEIPAHTEHVSERMQAAASAGWMGQHGLELVSFAIDTLAPSDLSDVQSLQWAEPLLGASAFTRSLTESASQSRSVPDMPEIKYRSWTCVCGTVSAGKFCPECGRSRTWICPCGQENEGKFCIECGRPRPD